jgi:hypothetical protein
METAQTMVDFAEFMAGMREIRKSQEETARLLRETNLIVKEIAQQVKGNTRQMKETDRQEQETEETDEWDEWYKKQWDKWIGGPDYFGDIPEHKVHLKLMEKFQELGFIFTQVSKARITDEEHDILTEVDAWLENDDSVMIVELRKNPDIDDINDHLKRMEKLRKHADRANDKRRYLGAIAGVVFGESEKIHALKQGFYVIEPSGKTFNITEPKGIYHLREW